MKLIAGLGNPGEKYEFTRHNAGFMAVNYLAEVFELDDFRKVSDHKAEIAIINTNVPIQRQVAGEKLIIIKPQTYMNLSGKAVLSVINYYKIDPKDLIVIYDDVDLEYGKLRIRVNGSAGGHKGVQSVIDEIKTEEFTRIRIGIKPEKPLSIPLESYVLGKLTEDEMTKINFVIEKIPHVIDIITKKGAEEAMNKFN